MISSEEYLISLIKELRTLKNETGWVEFKVNNDAPEIIGEYISSCLFEICYERLYD